MPQQGKRINETIQNSFNSVDMVSRESVLLYRVAFILKEMRGQHLDSYFYIQLWQGNINLTINFHGWHYQANSRFKVFPREENLKVND